MPSQRTPISSDATRELGASELAASRFLGILKSVFSPSLSEEEILRQAEERFAQKHPGTPIPWAINYAKGRAGGVAKSVGGPQWLQDLVRRTGLEEELKRAEAYLEGVSEFLELDQSPPIDSEDSNEIK